jgi:precorrin-3B synthase
MPEQAEIRVTPWKSLLLPKKHLDSLPARLDARDWISQSTDVRLRVSACTGAPNCPQAHIPAQPMALQFASSQAADRHLHISGCASSVPCLPMQQMWCLPARTQRARYGCTPAPPRRNRRSGHPFPIGL